MNLSNSSSNENDALVSGMINDNHNEEARLSVMSAFLQEPHKNETGDGEKAGSRTGSISTREGDGTCVICASSAGRQNSAFQLIIDPREDKKLRKIGSLNVLKRALYFLLIVFLVAVLATMTALYVSQKRKFTSIKSLVPGKSESFTKVVTTSHTNIKPTFPPCVPVLNAHPIPEIPSEIKELSKKLSKEVQLFQKMYQVKAASVAFSYRGKIWWSDHVGSMNYSNSSAPLPNNDTPYPVASITKLFTTIMMHKLFEQGKIKSLDDPVNKYVPEFSVKNPFNKEKVTLRQLSCMMSGLPREAPCFPAERLNHCPFNSSEMWTKIANISLIMPPDKNPSYSNIGYSVLGSALERIAGMKYDKWMMKNVFDPLRMKNSGFDLLESAKRFPVSTNLDGSTAHIFDWGWQKSSGGLYSSINDLNQVAKMLFELMNDTTVLHRTTARKIFKPAFLYNSGHGTGYSFEILNSKVYEVTKHHSKSNLEHLIYTKNGASFGYGAWIGFVPEMKFAVFSLVAHAGKEMAPGVLLTSPLKAIEPIEKVLLRSLPKYILPPSPSMYIGKYKLIQYWPLVTDILEILVKGDTLYLRIQWLEVPLSYVSHLVLVTGHYGKNPMRRCEDFFLSTGFSYLKCFFKKPSRQGGKSPGFHIEGITTYGIAEFKRIL